MLQAAGPGGAAAPGAEGAASAPGSEDAATTGSATQRPAGAPAAAANPDGAAWVNHAVTRWEQQRAAWCTPSPQFKRVVRPAVLSPDVTYEDILLTDRPFAAPVPLREMVDLLVDVWDEEGLYDNAL